MLIQHLPIALKSQMLAVINRFWTCGKKALEKGFRLAASSLLAPLADCERMSSWELSMYTEARHLE